MAHGTHLSDKLPASLKWTLAVLTVLTLVFGIYGHLNYERTAGEGEAAGSSGQTATGRESSFVDVASAVYHSIQLLIVHGNHLTGKIPRSLHLARFLGACAFFLGGVLAASVLVRDGMLRLRLRVPWRRDHVVICGLGDLGLRLALAARGKNKFVVAIDDHAKGGASQQARDRNVLVIEGDACDRRVLRQARIDRAEFIAVVCGDDATNIAVAASIGRALCKRPIKRQPLLCRLLINDHELRQLLMDESLFPVSGDQESPNQRSRYRINFGDLDRHATSARQCLREHELDFQPIRQGDKTRCHLIVLGFGPMGQSMALQAARIGHFANGTKGCRLKITVLDDDPDRYDSFVQRYPKLELCCESEFQEVDLWANEELVERLERMSKRAAEEDMLITYAVCLEDEKSVKDSQNLRIGVELSRRTENRPVQTLVYQSTRRGLAALLVPQTDSDQARGAGRSPRLHAFGMVEDIFNWDVLVHESEDRLARALHEEYWKRRQAEGVEDSKNPHWEELDHEDLKESNRCAADHIPIKLRALGYHSEPIRLGQHPVDRFDEKDTLVLAQMEHARWCAERWLAGWEHDPVTDRARKRNKNLVGWDELEPEERRKDPEQIQAIFRALRSIGQGIYR